MNSFLKNGIHTTQKTTDDHLHKWGGGLRFGESNLIHMESLFVLFKT